MSASAGGIALVAHGGGPTAVINASLVGVVEEARRQPAISQLWGAAFGLQGILRGELVELFAQSPETLDAIAQMPSSALGTGRLEADDAVIERVLQTLRARDVRFFFYTGGNG